MDALESRRKQLIAALRSGNYEKAENALYSWNHSESQGYCCIGVGCSVGRHPGIVAVESDPIQYMDSDGQWDENGGYNFFRETYAVPLVLSDRLAKMNDGDDRFVGRKNPRSVYPKGPRDFKFIARYLEVVWNC
jgi:hypothetical protein